MEDCALSHVIMRAYTKSVPLSFILFFPSVRLEHQMEWLSNCPMVSIITAARQAYRQGLAKKQVAVAYTWLLHQAIMRPLLVVDEGQKSVLAEEEEGR